MDRNDKRRFYVTVGCTSHITAPFLNICDNQAIKLLLDNIYFDVSHRKIVQMEKALWSRKHRCDHQAKIWESDEMIVHYLPRLVTKTYLSTFLMNSSLSAWLTNNVGKFGFSRIFIHLLKSLGYL